MKMNLSISYMPNDDLEEAFVEITGVENLVPIAQRAKGMLDGDNSCVDAIFFIVPENVVIKLLDKDEKEIKEDDWDRGWKIRCYESETDRICFSVMFQYDWCWIETEVFFKEDIDERI